MSNASQTPLHELLASVPEDARLVIEDKDAYSTTFIPVGRYCQEASLFIKEALAQPEQEPVAWGVDWGKAGDIPCVSIIKRLPDGGIEVLACEYAPYSYASPPQSCQNCASLEAQNTELDAKLADYQKGETHK